MTFDNTFRDGSSFGKLADSLCYWCCLSLKANFQKKNCGNTSTKGFLGLLNQVLVFFMFFS